jgi:hypothetical protein
MGTRYFIQPIAPVEENTVRVPAGALTFGLEMRELNPAIVSDFYSDRPDEPAVRAIVEKNGELEDSGPSIHVFGTDDGLEYLRFDCFVNGPHYHYVHPQEEYQVVNTMDPVAFGDPFEWAVGRLRSRLAEMLRESGGEQLADSLDPAAVDTALDRLAELRAAAAAGITS